MIDRSVIDNNPALNQVFIKRDEHGRLLPGGAMLNPAGRPPNPVSLVKRLKDRLEASPKEQDDIINSLLGLSKTEMSAIQLIFERIDGKVANNLNIQSISLHLGDEYAKNVLNNVRNEQLDYKNTYLLDVPGEDSTLQFQAATLKDNSQ